MKIASILGGLAGACALTLLNEGVKRFSKDAPRLDLLGMNMLAKYAKTPMALGLITNRFKASLVGDVLSNSFYYAMADGSTNKKTLWRGVLLGVGAGLGALALPKPLGVTGEYTNRTVKTQTLTMAYYIIGGLVAAAAMNLMEKRDMPEEVADVKEEVRDRAKDLVPA